MRISSLPPAPDRPRCGIDLARAARRIASTGTPHDRPGREWNATPARPTRPSPATSGLARVAMLDVEHIDVLASKDPQILIAEAPPVMDLVRDHLGRGAVRQLSDMNNGAVVHSRNSFEFTQAKRGFGPIDLPASGVR